MRNSRSLARGMTVLAVVVIIVTALASYLTVRPEWFVAGAGVAVFLATIAVLWLTEPLLESSDHLVTSYDNLRYLENKRDSIEEARRRHGAWSAVATSHLDKTGTDWRGRFLAQRPFLMGDPWFPEYRKVCEHLEGTNPGLDINTAFNDLAFNKARQRMIEFERVIEHLEQRSASSFHEVEDLRNPDAYFQRHKMFPYDRSKTPS